MSKHVFCILENKGADQLSGYRAADQRLCFHYVDSTSPLKFQASSYLLLSYSQVCVVTQKIGFPTKQLNYKETAHKMLGNIYFTHISRIMLITGNSIELLGPDGKLKFLLLKYLC